MQKMEKMQKKQNRMQKFYMDNETIEILNDVKKKMPLYGFIREAIKFAYKNGLVKKLIKEEGN